MRSQAAPQPIVGKAPTLGHPAGVTEAEYDDGEQERSDSPGQRRTARRGTWATDFVLLYQRSQKHRVLRGDGLYIEG